LDLGDQPPANAFLADPASPEDRYPLALYLCLDCNLMQLVDVVSPTVLFRNYAYFTGQSSLTMREHFEKLAGKLTAEFDIGANDLVVDIGSNDGTFLKNFKTPVLGVDPAENVVAKALENGVPTLCEAFTPKTAHDIVNKHQQAKVVTATNVLAHVDNLHEFMAGVRLLLAEDGVFVVEVPYGMKMLEKTEFDTIYHEHLSYFTVLPLDFLASKFGLKLFWVEEIPVHGGSIRCYMGNVGEITDEGLRSYKEREAKLLDSLYSFKERVLNVREKLLHMLSDLKRAGMEISGYGAPAKGNTLLNYCKIGSETLKYLSDTTPFKQGKYSPGMHIPVVSPEHFHCCPPDFALLLAWNYEEEILEKEYEFIDGGGRFIVPIPEPRIVP
jgi:SAM-dependent methyltransferase